MKLIKILCALCLTSMLVACGGGGAALGALVGAVLPDAPANVAPVANAGVTQNITLGYAGGVASKVVYLNGTSSSDANGNALTFKWFLTQKPAGSVAALSSTTDPKPTFNADVVGEYVISLFVNDGKLESKEAVVVISASISNSAPVANAGVKQYVVFGPTSTVTLDGTYSTDADNDQIFYKWTIMQKPSGSDAKFVDDTKARPTFIADKLGDYVAQLVINDGKVSSLPTSVLVTATNLNRPPDANAGEDKNVSISTTVPVGLDGTNSLDRDFDTLTYKWDWMSYPGTKAPTLVSATSADPSTSPKPSFMPNLAGTYVLTLTVYDGKLYSAADSITITVSDTNNAPVAAAGADQNVLVSTLVSLDGTGSTDADKLDTLSYKWKLNAPSGSSAALSSEIISKPSFRPDIAGVYVASLVVSDGKASSLNQSLTRVTAALTANSPPVANAGTSYTVTSASAVTLTGSGTDADAGTTLLYKWYLVSKPTGSTTTVSSTPTTTATTSVVPDVVGVYVVVLILNDGKADSNPATFTITRSS